MIMINNKIYIIININMIIHVIVQQYNHKTLLKNSLIVVKIIIQYYI